jgi:mannosyltransferase OCH1-like enzyme
MIPKIIYHIWLSDKPCPDIFKKFTDTWSQIMPDYKIEHITVDNVPRTPEINSLLEQKKWALANHYARYYLLYHNGGIYMDNDMQVVKRFDDLLSNDLVIGREDYYTVNNAIMMATPNNAFIKKCLDVMDNKDYPDTNQELETGPRLTSRFGSMITKVWDEVYFYPFHYSKTFTPDCIKPETYTVHHWTHSWK